MTRGTVAATVLLLAIAGLMAQLLASRSTVVNMIAGPIGYRCDVACFEGISLSDKSPSEIYSLLETHKFVDPTSLRLTRDIGFQYIRWDWTDSSTRFLDASDLGMFTIDESNTIIFSNETDRMIEINLLFAIPLSQLIREFGEPRWIAPAYPTRFGEMVFDLIYYHPLGHFQVWTTCDRPSLMSNTPVYSFHYASHYASNPTEVLPRWLPWQGYTSQLPDCSTFLP